SGAWSALESLLPRSPFSSRSSISTRHRFNYRMHVQTLSSKIPRMRPRRVSGTPMACGGQGAQRYSELAQITPANVKDLKHVWTFHTGDIPKKYGSELTPPKGGNAVYGCTPIDKLFALNAATGEKLWMYDPQVPASWVPYTAACRGVAFYSNPNATAGQVCAERIIEGTLDMRLIAVDAKSGQPCQDFGKNGSADL